MGTSEELHLKQMQAWLEQLGAGPAARLPVFVAIEDRLFRILWSTLNAACTVMPRGVSCGSRHPVGAYRTLSTKVLPDALLNKVKRSKFIYNLGRRARFRIGSALGACHVEGIPGRKAEQPHRSSGASQITGRR
jgi:hypothetical protein